MGVQIYTECQLARPSGACKFPGMGVVKKPPDLLAGGLVNYSVCQTHNLRMPCREFAGPDDDLPIFTSSVFIFIFTGVIISPRRPAWKFVNSLR
jgi:hypothetical protein